MSLHRCLATAVAVALVLATTQSSAAPRTIQDQGQAIDVKQRKSRPVYSYRRRPRVDVVFVLDTTGSMSGLIEGAKRKIWSIANQILRGQPRPDVRIGLIGYRDHGDDYVTRSFPLTGEIDDVYSNLQQFAANGGGDTPEHVNRALKEAIKDMQWRQGQNVLRQIFLVGDAPPHEGRDGLHSSQLARTALRRGIVINSVRCGAATETARVWQRIAALAGGKYASIRQDGAMIAIATPYDRELARLNAELSATLLPTGGRRAKAAVARRAASNRAMGMAAQAESATFRARSGRIDGQDLLGQLKQGKKLSDFGDDELPAAVRARPKAARKVYLAGVARKRASVQGKILELSKKRDAFVKARSARKGTTSFDDTITSALKAQGASAGLAY